jgi:archaellum component FlaC
MADNQMIYELLIEMKHEMSGVKHEITGIKHEITGINERLSNLESEVKEVKTTVNQTSADVKGMMIQLAKVSEDVNENNKIKKLFSAEALEIVS